MSKKAKTYIVPCFIIVENASSVMEATQEASLHQEWHNGSILLLDEDLPTVEITLDPNTTEYPHSMIQVEELKKTFKSKI
jgi:hypothetical protein